MLLLQTKKNNGINLDMTPIQVNLLELVKIPKGFILYILKLR